MFWFILISLGGLVYLSSPYNKKMENKKILEIKGLINNRKMIEAKNMLDRLGENLDDFQKFFDEIKKLCRNSGRTNMINKSELELLITKYG